MTTTPTTSPEPTADLWPTIHALVAWLDKATAARGASRGEERLLRILKISEEAGEVAEAVIGTAGQNPRKGVSHSREDITTELCDVVITTLAALPDWTDDPEGALARRLAVVAQRIGATDVAP